MIRSNNDSSLGLKRGDLDSFVAIGACEHHALYAQAFHGEIIWHVSDVNVLSGRKFLLCTEGPSSEGVSKCLQHSKEAPAMTHGEERNWMRTCRRRIGRLSRCGSGVDGLQPLAWPDGFGEHHVLWFEVCVDDVELSVHVVDAHQHLLCDVLHQWQGDPPVVVYLDERQKVVSQHLCMRTTWHMTPCSQTTQQSHVP